MAAPAAMAIALALSASLAAASPPENWAVLVAGSRGYYNYRHQADLCHAFQVLTRRGMPGSRMVTMLYDDVASAEQNPFPGQLFNHPNGEDVYSGCQKDYTGDAVNPDNFIAVLTGDAAAAGGRRVLNSTSGDHVFVFFVDHGAVDLVAFPDDVLTASKLNAALAAAHRNGRFKQLVFYLETCESGSMFGPERLPKGLPVFAVTAANAHESSWGTYCPPHDAVRGVHMDACLGDLFSVNWIEDAAAHAADSAAGGAETLHRQFAVVRAKTTKSHVQQFGNLTISYEDVREFESEPSASARVAAGPPGGASSTSTSPEASTDRASMDASAAASSALRERSAVPSRDIGLHTAYHTFLRTGSTAAGEALKREVDARLSARDLWQRIFLAAAPSDRERSPGAAASGWPAPGFDIASTWELDTTHVECHARGVDAFARSCGGWAEAMLPYSAALHRLCGLVGGDEAAVEEAIARECARAPA